MKEKGRSFDGWLSGRTYDFVMNIFGFSEVYVSRMVDRLPLEGGMAVLDLGCGTGISGLVICDRIARRFSGLPPTLTGIDLSRSQLDEAGKKGATRNYSTTFQVGSMDETGLADDRFDLVVASLAIHEASPMVRRATIPEIRRLLKPGGVFVLVEWSRPRFGLKALLWLPFLFKDGTEDNWRNRYAKWCLKEGLRCDRDEYLDSMLRLQVFRKP